MGKLSKIKRAFNALPHERKIAMRKYNYGCTDLGEIGIGHQGRPWGFTYHRSYRKFVTKLVNDYNKYARQQNHVVEIAYLNKEPWAIAQVEKRFKTNRG